MNKFLNRSVKPKRDDRTKETVYRTRGTAYEELEEFASYWSSLYTARKKMERSLMYAKEDQWGDYIKDPDTGKMMTEGELIKKNGKVPLKNNMIAPIVKNIEGQFRRNVTKPICSVRDRDEAKVGEMMSIAMEYAQSLNEITELDAASLMVLECGGYIAQRIEFGYNEYKHMNDAWVYNVDPSRLFFNTNIEDQRGWDITCIGEIFDMDFEQVVAAFAKSKKDREWLESIYGTDDHPRRSFVDGVQGYNQKNADFYTPAEVDLCRVVLGWKLESRDAYFYHDTLDGSWGFVGLNEVNKLEYINQKRISEALEAGVEEEDILLIEYEFKVERYWYYRYLSPWGDVLQEGRSPYWHGQHNYVFHAYPIIHGKIFNFIEDFIDQQRSINRTMTLIDFIRSSSAKGLVVVDEDAFDSMSREEVIDEYVRYNGVLFCRPKPGKDIRSVITQLNGAGAIQGDYELLSLQLKLINDIAGVNSAMQGKDPSSGTAASLYAQQTENASMNLKGLFDSFKAFRKRRDLKLMQTIQQYYDSPRYIELGGKDYSEESKYYDPEKVQGAQLDLELTEGTNTPTFQMLENEFLMKLFEMQAINVKTLLENSSLPFASKILESVKRAEQEMAENQNMTQVDPALMQQIASQNPALMEKMMNDANASPQDGIIQQAA
jgi:hypothetical protein